MSENRECPECRKLGHDKDGDHLFLMEDGETWYCNKPYHPPYREKDGDTGGTKVYGMTLDIIKKLPFYGSEDRRVSAETHKAFRVRTELSEANRSPIAVYYPETYRGVFKSYKQRKLPKKFFTIKTEEYCNEVPDLFGQWRCPKSGKYLLICAGEEDTMAAYEMLKEKYPDYDPAVVGLPRGESGFEPVAENLGFIRGFDNVILATDMDAAGRDALSKLAPIIGENVLTLNLSEKDISDMRVKHKDKEFLNAYFNAKEYRPSHIITVDDILEEAIAPVPWGLCYPWDSLTQLTYGMKAGGEVIGIGAAPGKHLPL